VAKPRIFLNYRREDTRGYAGRLYDRLTSRFREDQIFRDIDAIPPGIDYMEYVDQVVGQCDVMLVLIGETWISVKDGRGRRRLEDPRDLVRLEIAAALERNIPVVPVLIQGARMPTEEDLPEHIEGLARRNALEMSDSHWNHDWERLTRALDQLASRQVPNPYPRGQGSPGGRPTPELAELPHGGSGIPESDTARRRWPIARPVVVALAAILPLVLFLTAGYLVRRDTGTSSTPTSLSATTTSHSMKPSLAFPNNSERQLLKYIPPRIRPDCDRASQPLPHAVAAVRCTGNNLPSVQYNLFHSNDAMYRLFNSRIKAVGAHTGSCKTTAANKHIDKVIHDGVTVGSLLCYERQGEARLEWTNKVIHVYTHTSSRSMNTHDMYHDIFMHAGPHSHQRTSSHG
jgi:hypothetical protein